MAKNSELKVAVIGAGPGGIAAAHELLQQGFTQFTIFEQAGAVGGTWHLHSYPGLACDIWAHSYSFSYALNPDWSSSHVGQKEIEAYLQRCAREFGLDPHIQFNTKIVSAHYQDNGSWVLHTEDSQSLEYDVIINGMGNQHTPLYPDAKGIESFSGDYWHATQWNHDVDLKGKKIAVVGSAASAVQIVPEMAELASHLTVLQRTPNWIMGRGNKPYSERRRKWFKRLPFLIKMTRAIQGFLMGMVKQATTIGHNRMGQFADTAIKNMHKAIPAGELRDAVTPKDLYGCKRSLVSDDFYPALMRENVELIAEGLAEVKPNGIVTASGREIDVDVIIYCTGYRILDFDRIDVRGTDGQSLAEVMAAAPEAYKGITAPGFPNYFFIIGPNGLVLGSSFFANAEANVETIVRLLGEKQAADVSSMSVKKSLHREYNDWVQTEVRDFSWGEPSCLSYYNTASGQVPYTFPGDIKYWKKIHGESGLHEYDCS